MKTVFSGSKGLALKLIVLACILLLGVSVWLWWTKIFLNPDRVLSGAISRSLQTSSITKKVDQSGQTGGLVQTSYLSFFPPAPVSETKTVLSQGIGSNTTSVTTETIGTPEADFVRYTEVKGAEGIPGADNLNGLLGLWAKKEQNLEKGEKLSFLNETLFGVVAFGNFNDVQRSQLLDLINQKNLYKYTAANKKIENKRPVYVYDLSINPQDLVSVMRDYVTLTGIGDPTQLDPNQYQGLGSVKVKMTVDILSRQVVKIEYGTGRIETYSGQNLYRSFTAPQKTIPIEELQKRLQQAQTS